MADNLTAASVQVLIARMWPAVPNVFEDTLRYVNICKGSDSG